MGISTFGSYRSRYPLRGPAIPAANPDENRVPDIHDGVQLFSDAPFPAQPQDLNPSDSEPNNEWRCLRAVRVQDVPFVRERLAVSPPLQSKLCKHTNLTGGDEAHCGGETWFVSGQRLIINGASCRYPPRELPELEEIVRAFEDAGHEVWSMGWDPEIDKPARVMRGNPPW